MKPTVKWLITLAVVVERLALVLLALAQGPNHKLKQDDRRAASRAPVSDSESVELQLLDAKARRRAGPTVLHGSLASRDRPTTRRALGSRLTRCQTGRRHRVTFRNVERPSIAGEPQELRDAMWTC